MMEALRSDTLHASGSMHSLSCINAHRMDELSKEKEEELLYGAGDDGDEEDALSDDSMRLRLSDDDEVEGGHEIKSVSNSPESKSKISESETASAKNEDSEMSPIAEKKLAKAESDTGRVNQEEQYAGNDFMDENQIEPRRSGTALRSWQCYDSYWRYVKSGNTRCFRNSSNPYPRYRQPRGRFRPQSCDYNVRFHNAFLPFERGRGNAMYNSYSRPMYGNRQQNRGFRQNTMQSSNSLTELEQNRASPSHTNVSPRTKANNESSVANKHNNTLGNESSVRGDTNHRSNESPNKSIDNVQSFHEKSSADPDIAIIETSLNLEHNLERNAEVIECDRNAEVLECDRNVEVIDDEQCKDIANTNVRILDANRSETRGNVDFSIDSRDSNDDQTRVDETVKNGTNNAHLVSEDHCMSDNSEKLEAAGASEQCAADENETVERAQPTSSVVGMGESNDEAAKPTDTDTNDTAKDKDGPKLGTSEPDTDREPAHANQKTELPQANCQPISSSSSLAGGTAASDELQVDENPSDGKTEETLATEKKEVRSENSKSSEDRESRVWDSTIVESSNNFADNKRNDKVKITETDANDKKCDNNTQLESANSTNFTKVSTPVVAEDRIAHPRSDPQQQGKDVGEKSVEATEKEKSVRGAASKSATKPVTPSEQIESLPSQTKSSNVKPTNDLSASASDVKDNSANDVKVIVAAAPAPTQRRRRRAKKMIVITAQEFASEEDKQVRESGRQKRRTAKNAEEIIRKKFLNHDSDLESSDGSDKFVAVNYKMAQDARALSPPSLKRSPDINSSTLNDGMKKIKLNSEAPSDESKVEEVNSETVKKLNYVRRFFQRDLNDKLPKLKQQELEELLIQKIVETITMRDEIGRLREQARISERNQEAMRAKCQQLAKQIKDFDMVLSRNAADRRANNDKPVPPIKINRSVGLQVNFVTDHGIQNLRQLQQTSSVKSLQVSSSNNTPNTSLTETSIPSNPRKGIKVRSPRRNESINDQSPVVSQIHNQSSNIISNSITPAALVVTKPVDAQHPLPMPNPSNLPQILPNVPQPQPQQSQQAIVLNGKFPNQINRPGPPPANIVPKPRPNDLIDLTDEEEKGKATSSVPVVTTTITDQQVTLAPKPQQPCFQRVIQAIPGNVALTSQPPSIRVVQPATQPTPTALVNNMNAPRLAYVMQSGVGPARQLLIAPNSNPMRPVTSCRAPFSTLAYKTGISTIANGTVRVLTTPATSNIQLNKHPAPLPDIRTYAVNPLWKLPPPAPSLKISKVAHGIVLSWNMNLSDKYADIVSYQLYAYQEIVGVPPSSSQWKKVGDVRALPLPMACTLTQFSEGNNYYFAVRAVDTHSRKGQYSTPGNISL